MGSLELLFLSSEKLPWLALICLSCFPILLSVQADLRTQTQLAIMHRVNRHIKRGAFKTHTLRLIRCHASGCPGYDGNRHQPSRDALEVYLHPFLSNMKAMGGLWSEGWTCYNHMPSMLPRTADAKLHEVHDSRLILEQQLHGLWHSILRDKQACWCMPLTRPAMLRWCEVAHSQVKIYLHPHTTDGTVRNSCHAQDAGCSSPQSLGHQVGLQGVTDGPPCPN